MVIYGFVASIYRKKFFLEDPFQILELPPEARADPEVYYKFAIGFQEKDPST
jgi:hypothetical protein